MSTNFDIWQQNLPEEVLFWEQWLNPDNPDNKQRMEIINNSFNFIHLCQHLTNTTIKVLDVGSGPLTTIGTKMPGSTVELIACDPLADEYNAMLRKFGLESRANIQKVAGEDLNKVFAKDTFDIVHSANALDHAYDPLLCIKSMLDICKPGGWVIIIVVENVGEKENYQGLHQWNFSLSSPDQVSLSSPNQSVPIMVKEELDNVAQFKAYAVDHGNNLPIVQIDIQKAA